MKVTSVEKKKLYIHYIAIFLLMFGFGCIPAIEPVTQYGMRVLGAFLGCFYGWLIGQYIWPSLLALLVVGYYGTGSPLGLLSSAFGNQTIILCYFAFIFAYVIRKCGLLEVIANVLLSMKISSKGPWALAGVMWITTIVAAALISLMVPPIILVWSVFYGIMDKLEIPKQSPYSSVVLIGVVFFSHTGAVVLPYSGVLQMINGMMIAADPMASINILGHIIFWIFINVLLVFVFIAFFKYVVRIKIPFEEIPSDIIKSEKKPMTKTQKFVLGYIVLLCAGLIIPSILPAGSAVKTFMTGLGALGVFMVVNIMMAISIIGDESLQDIGEGFKDGIPWDVCFLLAAALTLAPIVTSAATGLDVIIANLLETAFAGKSTLIFIVIVLWLGSLLTNLINNAACMVLMIPMIAPFCASNSVSFAPICSMLCGILVCGMLLPSGGSGAAIMHGNSEYLKSIDVYKYTILFTVPFLIVMSVLGIPLANILI